MGSVRNKELSLPGQKILVDSLAKR